MKDIKNFYYDEGYRAGYDQANAISAEIKALDEYLKQRGLCLCNRVGKVLLGVTDDRVQVKINNNI